MAKMTIKILCLAQKWRTAGMLPRIVLERLTKLKPNQLKDDSLVGYNGGTCKSQLFPS